MARSGSQSAAKKARTEQERARVYRARAEWNENRIQRRTRDNVVAGVAGGVLILATIASQSVHAMVLDNAPEPEPTSTITPAPIPTETVAPTPDPSDSTEPEPSPEPTETDAP